MILCDSKKQKEEEIARKKIKRQKSRELMRLWCWQKEINVETNEWWPI